MTRGRDWKETPEDLELIYRAALDGRLERAFEHFFTEATGRAPTSLEEMEDYFCEEERQRAAATGSWEEVGLTLRHEWAAIKNSVDFSEQLRRAGIVPEALEPPRWQESEADRFMSDAMTKLSEHGDLSGLIAYLRSKHPLDRNALANKLEDCQTTNEVGHPRDWSIWDMVECSDKFYREWRRRNKEAGIRDRGFCKRMQYLSCVYAIETQAFFWKSKPDPEDVLKNLRRSKKRRNQN
jgi:hypothetical protein